MDGFERDRDYEIEVTELREVRVLTLVRAAAEDEARAKALVGETESETELRVVDIRSRGIPARGVAVIDEGDDPAPGFVRLTPIEALGLLRSRANGHVCAMMGEASRDLSRDFVMCALRTADRITLAPRHSFHGYMDHWVRAHMPDGTTIALASDHPED